MNLAGVQLYNVIGNIPRGCGGEPGKRNSLYGLSGIFPADAGVNLITDPTYTYNENIPRGCGGEPEMCSYSLSHTLYSPRMRG